MIEWAECAFNGSRMYIVCVHIKRGIIFVWRAAAAVNEMNLKMVYERANQKLFLFLYICIRTRIVQL